MKEDREQEKQPPAEPKREMSDFRKARRITAIPIVILTIIGAIGEMVYPTGLGSEIFGVPLAIAAGLWCVAIVAGIGFKIKKKGEIASGIFSGVRIGLVVFVLGFIVVLLRVCSIGQL